MIAEFEKETGIKVNFNYYSSNEELIVKLKATARRRLRSDHPLRLCRQILIKEGLLKKLDKDKFAYWHTINPALLGQYFDPENTYSIPFEWELFGFGIDKDYFEAHPTQPPGG